MKQAHDNRTKYIVPHVSGFPPPRQTYNSFCSEKYPLFQSVANGEFDEKCKNSNLLRYIYCNLLCYG